MLPAVRAVWQINNKNKPFHRERGKIAANGMEFKWSAAKMPRRRNPADAASNILQPHILPLINSCNQN